MKIMSISDIAISAIENEDKIKLMILREKWKELFSELAEISTVIDFNEKIIYIKSYDSVLKHYIFANKQKINKWNNGKFGNKVWNRRYKNKKLREFINFY